MHTLKWVLTLLQIPTGESVITRVEGRSPCIHIRRGRLDVFAVFRLPKAPPRPRDPTIAYLRHLVVIMVRDTTTGVIVRENIFEMIHTTQLWYS